MQQARRSKLLRPSGRLLESRSDPGPRGMIIAPRQRNLDASRANASAATESGLQTHPLLTFLFSLHLPLDFGGVCKNCAIRSRFFDSIRALHDPPGAFAKLLH